jgi:hypothetical protein
LRLLAGSFRHAQGGSNKREAFVKDFARRNLFLNARNRIETIGAWTGPQRGRVRRQDQINIENKSLRPWGSGTRSDHSENDRANECNGGKGHQNVKSVDEVHGNAPGSTSPALPERKPNRSPILKKSGTLIYPRPSGWGG